MPLWIYLLVMFVVFLVGAYHVGVLKESTRTEMGDAIEKVEHALRVINSKFDFDYHKRQLNWHKLGPTNIQFADVCIEIAKVAFIAFFWPVALPIYYMYFKGQAKGKLILAQHDWLVADNKRLEQIKRDEGWT